MSTLDRGMRIVNESDYFYNFSNSLYNILNSLCN